MSNIPNPSPDDISFALFEARDDALQKAEISGILSEAQRKQYRQTILKNLEIAIAGAPFLNNEQRKKWNNGISLLDITEAEELLDAIIRESMRYKKKTRDIRLEFLKTNPNISVS
ncbi:hypothetical protein IPN35_05050 [Candidatus Peregrinibacteria bacterium]|nr:MAG: hypothetical protein IPN35_05050 [Candidatus Peregrinibacteria bacterium]